jgi:hypothetical protein
VYCVQATEVAPTKTSYEIIDYHHRRGEFIRQIQKTFYEIIDYHHRRVEFIRPIQKHLTQELIIIIVGANLFA